MITGFEVIQFDLPPMQDMGTDYNVFNLVYQKGSTIPRQGSMLRMYTNYQDSLEAIDATGNVYAQQGSGLGVEFDWDWIEKHQVSRVKFN